MSCHVAGDSKEAVAFGLLHTILHAQGRANQDHPYVHGSTLLRGQPACTENEVLALYARCLRVVQGEAATQVTAETAGLDAPAPRPAALYS